MKQLKPLVVAIIIAFSITACGGGGNGKKETSQNEQNNEENKNIPQARYALSKAGSDENFVDYYAKAILKNSQGQQYLTKTDNSKSDAATAAPAVAESSASTSGAAAGSNVSSTNLIEKGVDELDYVKQNASHIFTTKTEKNPNHNYTNEQALYKHSIKVYAKPNTNAIATLPINEAVDFKGLFLNKNKLFSLKQKTNQIINYPRQVDTKGGAIALKNNGENAKLSLDVINVSNPNTPNIQKNYTWEGNYQNSRRIGNSVYVVSNSQLNDPWVCIASNASTTEPATTTTETTAVPDVQARSIAPGYCGQPSELTPEEIAKRMPIDIDGNKVKASECYIPRLYNKDYINTNITLITKVDLSGNENHTTTCIASSVDHIYMSPKSLYVTSSDYANTFGRYQGLTNINKFNLTDGKVKYAGGTSVKGNINWNSSDFSMNEHKDILRVLTTDNGYKGEIINSLHTFKESPTLLKLDRLATIPNDNQPASIGKPRESVKSIRFMGDEAYVVTFETKDPLYKIDLSNPAAPKIVGELEMPGYSAYLHRINDKYLLGVGYITNKDTRRVGIQTTVFDTSTANPVIVDQDTLNLIANNNSNVSFRLPLENDSRAITTLNDGQYLRVAVLYKIQEYSYDYNKQSFENNAMEYNINLATGEIDKKLKRAIVPKLIISKSYLSKEDATATALKEAEKEYIDKMDAASLGFYNSRERALIDNDDVYYNMFDGSLAKHLWGK